VRPSTRFGKSNIYVQDLPALPYDPGEQGDPMHSEAPAEMSPAAKKKAAGFIEIFNRKRPCM
jgi:hypothetical protein